MCHAIFYNGIDVLFYGWQVSTLRIIFIAEIIIAVIGVLVGIVAPKKRMTTILLAILDGVGLILVLKNQLFGLSSDAYILVPFVGEMLIVGTSIALLILRIKGNRKCFTG